MLTNLGDVRKKFVENATEEYADDGQGYYNSPQGFFDRLQMISVDDRLIDVTERKGTFGYAPIFSSFAESRSSCLLAQQTPRSATVISTPTRSAACADDDTTTGISFTPTGEGYHIDRWVGVLILAPVLWIMLFTLFDSLCGTVRETPGGCW